MAAQAGRKPSVRLTHDDCELCLGLSEKIADRPRVVDGIIMCVACRKKYLQLRVAICINCGVNLLLARHKDTCVIKRRGRPAATRE